MTTANPMALTEQQPNYTQSMIRAVYGNQAAAEKNIQSMYKTVYSNPTVTGRSSIRHTSINNYFGYLHIYPTDPRVLYHVGLPTGGGRDVFPPLLMPNIHLAEDKNSHT